MNGFLKEDIEETDLNMLAWLNGTGMVAGHWGTGFLADLENNAAEGNDLEKFYTDPETVAAREEVRLCSKSFPLDLMPIAIPDMNTLPLALYLGAEPSFSRNNIWYRHTDLSPENDKNLAFDPGNHWFRNHVSIFEAVRERSRGRYFIGLPALVPNLDVLVELRGAQNLMMDLVTDPEWVHEKLKELNRGFFEVYPRMLSLASDSKGWSTHGYFMFRGPGKVGITHCDTAALISVDMFKEFVLPRVREQCEYLDYSLYHVDGPQALRTVDPLLEIDTLTALQFTPGPQVPQGGNPCWYDLYRKIKAAGKSVMAVWIEPEEIKPLLDAVGPEGMYLMINLLEERQIKETALILDQYR
jgi:hypothetical protein